MTSFARSPLTLPAQPVWPGRDPLVEVVLPVSHEEVELEPFVRRLRAFVDSGGVPYRCRITIADNARTDGNWAVAARLATELPDVGAVRFPAEGRGGALRRVWSASDAQILASLDVDLATDLGAFFPVISALVSGHSDVAIGSRLARGARADRGPKREFLSRSYHRILRSVLQVSFSDAHCGFKALTADAAQRLLPLVEDSEGFFDTELLVLAERSGLRIYEVPVDWPENPARRVDLVATVLSDLAGVRLLRRRLHRATVPSNEIARARGQRPDPVLLSVASAAA